MKKILSPFYNSLKHFKPLKNIFFENRSSLAIGLLCLFVVDILQLLIPLVIKKAIDSLTARSTTSSILLKYGFTILTIAVFIAILRYIWRYFVLGHSRKVEEELRNILFRHLQTLSYSFYQKTKTGDLMARAINDINYVRMGTGMGLVAMMDGLIMGLAAICFMVYIDPLLTLIALIPAPIVIFLSKKFTRRMSSGYENVQNIFSELTERVRETFSGIKVVKAFQRESWGNSRIEDKGKDYMLGNISLARTLALFFPIMALFTNTGMVIVIWLGGRLTIIGQITTGDFVAFIGYLNLLTWPMMAMGWVINLFQRSAASMRRINRILDEKPDITGPVFRKNISPMTGEIVFHDLSLKYPGHDKYAIQNLSLNIGRGETFSIVGPVGSGKTTLLLMIPRILDPTGGSILIDGKDIRGYSLLELRRNIGFVTQETIIFSDSIRNNVVFGRDDISEEVMERALKTAFIYDEIMDLERGVDTVLGERGITLSGGQRQRLTIARAIVTDPPVLILDDALSMVDIRTEEKILNQILESRIGKTNLIVSHRLLTISRANQIAVLNKGMLVEKGNYKILIDKGDTFSKLYNKQLLAQALENGTI
ncbi:MAG: ABC transporter ATP-binding protein [Deltaproteobacteria bacterium]|nr:ABC transporter ATP-binding protein [Deltaproteobacteria bacterium]